MLKKTKEGSLVGCLEAKNDTYSVELVPQDFTGVSYCGYINNKYAGCVVGIKRSGGVFDITKSTLRPEFRGTKAVRAFKEIIDAVMLDYPIVRSRIDNQDNDEIKIVLSAGFRIIGTMSYNNEVSVELLKIKEDM